VKLGGAVQEHKFRYAPKATRDEFELFSEVFAKMDLYFLIYRVYGATNVKPLVFSPLFHLRSETKANPQV
jgi:hypothetical protein